MDNIFYINSNKGSEQFSYKYYTILGNHDSLDDDDNPIVKDKNSALAYSRTLGSDETYYIKIGLYGRVYNPIGLYSEGKQNKFLSKVGKNEYNFVKVNSKVFGMYINFLKTKNIAWLNNAEREMT
jgi:hypothetical protein